MIGKARITAIIVLIILASSGAAAQDYPGIDEDTANAFAVSFQAYFFAALMGGFGQAPPGTAVDINDQGVTLVFDNAELAALQVEENFGYRTISGTIKGVETPGGSNMEADLVLAGGAVKNLSWSVENFDASAMDDRVVFRITADGRSFRASMAELQ